TSGQLTGEVRCFGTSVTFLGMDGRDHPMPLTFSLVLNLGETRPVTYPVRIVLDEGNLANRISEVREWLNKHGVDPGALQYRMAAEDVELRIDFVTLERCREICEYLRRLGVRRQKEHTKRGGDDRPRGRAAQSGVARLVLLLQPPLSAVSRAYR